MNQLNPLPNFAEKDKTLVMTGIHKWSHAQYFTTRLHLIFFSVLDLVHHKLARFTTQLENRNKSENSWELHHIYKNQR